METKYLNRISIKQYLAELNIHPVTDKGYYGMYYSPFREDHNASFKVDFSKNLWIDFGSNEGGTMIDLVMRLDNCTVKEAIRTLERKHDQLSVGTYQRDNVPTDSFSFHGERENQPAISILKVVPLTNQALVDYLTERQNNIDIAKEHCKEVYYAVNGKSYFAIAFKNDSGGYELRNKYFKGCTSKDISISNNKAETCLVFEGFMDYLSYLTIKEQQQPLSNIVVLNSIANLFKAIDFIKSHPKVYTYLDNDEEGRKATHIINNICKSHIDKSSEYIKYKDLNEYLCERKLEVKEEQKRKPSRGFKM